MIELVKRNDEHSWRLLVHLYCPLVLNWCRQEGLTPREAKDVTTDVFLKAHELLTVQKSTVPRSSFRGWLRVVAKQTIDNFIFIRVSN